MTNAEVNLRVLTDHIDELAEQQSRAADQFTGANRAVAGASSRITATHGVICALTSEALATADEARQSLGLSLFRRSEDLSAKLTTAASNYKNADYLAGQSIGQQCRS
ncbi:hypothetical protein BST22_17295 [Mycolicibacterium chubuense]|nr:hypothetical protein BST22_17295 [Mycolicibacterium chubuense]